MSPEHHFPVDAALWSACAGAGAHSHLPAVGSHVYYLPKPHSEQSRPSPSLSPLAKSKPLIRCRVLSVRHLASSESEEVFAAVRLKPVVFPAQEEEENVLSGGGPAAGRKDHLTQMQSFAKILTQSDANNGGGFSVPRFCADNILPPLDYEEDPPVQTIRAVDIKGRCWEFRHIYRGTPKRHLLTTGWSRFVNSKRLVAGDSVVFMKKRSGELHVGVRRRRSRRVGGDREGRSPVAAGFSTELRWRFPAKEVEAAAEAAARGEPFDLMWYPAPSRWRFLVGAKVADCALRLCWARGTRVKMAFEEDDCGGSSNSMTWFKGTVAGISVDCCGNWTDSPLRMLQIEWDEEEAMRNMKRVSPWEVEQVTRGPFLELDMNSPKRVRAPPPPVDGREPYLLHSMFRYGGFRAGTSAQGAARHEPRLCGTDLQLAPPDPVGPTTGPSSSAWGRPSVSRSHQVSPSSVINPINSIRLFGQVIVPGSQNATRDSALHEDAESGPRNPIIER